jgi:hypothetical protein
MFVAAAAAKARSISFTFRRNQMRFAFLVALVCDESAIVDPGSACEAAADAAVQHRIDAEIVQVQIPVAYAEDGTVHLRSMQCQV